VPKTVARKVNGFDVNLVMPVLQFVGHHKSKEKKLYHQRDLIWIYRRLTDRLKNEAEKEIEGKTEKEEERIGSVTNR